MIRSLVELVFEDLSEATASRLVHTLTGCSTPMPTSSDPDLLFEKSVAEWRLSIDVVVRDTMVRLLRHDPRHYDIEINFSVEDANTPSLSRLQETLHSFAMETAIRHDVENFYAGLEPADDVATRLFTARKPGPLHLKDKIA